MPFGSILSTLGNVDWASMAKPAELGLTGAGLIGNLMNQKARSNELNYLKQQQAGLQDPTKLATEVAGATQPLNRALVESVGNTVNAQLAEQGLSQAPGIAATNLSQALAPFQQQNQATALQLVLARLGLPLSYGQAILGGLPQNSNLAPLLALLQQKPGTGTWDGTPSGFYAGLGKSPNIPVGGDYANQGPFMGPSEMLPPDIGGLGGWMGDTSTVDQGAFA